MDVTSKEQMFDMLRRGMFGNTTPNFGDVASWKLSPEHDAYSSWGVRSHEPGGPCRMFCSTDEVEGFAGGRPVNIAPMIDVVRTVTLWADVYDDADFVVYCIEYPPKGANWRELMPMRGVHHYGLSARMLLRRHLTESSLADLWALFDLYPGHVVELSAVEGTFGTVSGRNGVIWEVRKY